MKFLIIGKSDTDKQSVTDILRDRYGYASAEYVPDSDESKNADILIVKPDDFEKACTENGRHALYICYLKNETPQGKCIKMPTPETERETELFSRLDEFLDTRNMSITNVVAISEYVDDKTDAAYEYIAGSINSAFRLHANMALIIDELADEGVLMVDEDGNMMYRNEKDETLESGIPKDVLVASCERDEVARLQVFNDWLMIHTPERRNPV